MGLTGGGSSAPGVPLVDPEVVGFGGVMLSLYEPCGRP